MLNHTAQVETAEIADAALDAVSGGLAAGGAGALSIETPLAHLGADLAAVASRRASRPARRPTRRPSDTRPPRGPGSPDPGATVIPTLYHPSPTKTPPGISRHGLSSTSHGAPPTESEPAHNTVCPLPRPRERDWSLRH